MAGAGSVAERSEALGEGAWQDRGTVNPVGNIGVCSSVGRNLLLGLSILLNKCNLKLFSLD